MDNKIARLIEIDKALEDPKIWTHIEKMQHLNKEKKILNQITQDVNYLVDTSASNLELMQIAKKERDEITILSIESDIQNLRKKIETVEFRLAFCNEMDPYDCFLDVQAGVGGTEACDWANMLLRQYLRYCEHKGFKTEILEISNAEIAGIKSASVQIEGEYAYGYLRNETGIHRLVRKSPFDSSQGRHTSFASIFVYPKISHAVEIQINPADIRVDTYRASGAGGQHINKTDSAVRITHIPTKIVVQCQSDRSQHRNRSTAMSMLQARLYEYEMNKRKIEQEKLEENKMNVGWGNQIRSYVLDQSRIKDLRTNVVISNTQKVLDGHLDEFIEASLRSRRNKES